MSKVSEQRAERARRKLEAVLSVATATKDALIEDYKKNGAFVDMDYLAKEGILSESIGLTGLLLLVTAFDDDRADIITEEDRREIEGILASAIGKLYGWVSEQGYTAAPLVAAPKLFNRDFGYVDTLTWVLSTAILTRRLEMSGSITLSEEIREQYMSLMASSLSLLLSAQHEKGMWGFRSDTGCVPSLYYTYSAGASLADFFDYILGEVAYLDEELSDEEKDARCVALRDNEALAYLDRALGGRFEGTVEEAVLAARRRLQTWLIDDCLVLMPRLAACEDLNGEEGAAVRETLGLFKHTTESKYFRPYLRYYNLNYVYYLLDLMVTASTDRRYAELCESGELEALRARCAEYLDEQDCEYFLGDPADPSATGHMEDLWKAMMEQTLHTARAQYMVASRTGDLFWGKAELPIVWEHTAKSAAIAIDGIDNKDKLKDPSIAPMALRANVMFSYYISEQPDMAVDRLFEDIDRERAHEAAEGLRVGLWDGARYNLLITERSIEAIVDYYDYLNKFEPATHGEETAAAAPAEAAAPPRPSAIDLAIEEKIAAYLSSEEGRALLSAAAPAAPAPTERVAPAPVAGALTVEGVTDLLRAVVKKDRKRYEPDGDEYDQLMVALEALFAKVVQCSIHKTVAEGLAKLGRSEEELAATASEIYRQQTGLLLAMGRNENLKDGDNKLEFLYTDALSE